VFGTQHNFFLLHTERISWFYPFLDKIVASVIAKEKYLCQLNSKSAGSSVRGSIGHGSFECYSNKHQERTVFPQRRTDVKANFFLLKKKKKISAINSWRASFGNSAEN
jgi:hypothetical protein